MTDVREEEVAAWGYAIGARAERAKSPAVMRRVFWVDAASAAS